MVELFADLHIHSVLSPCGDDLMTPNNIVNMSLLKELDVIAVADHNNARNLPSIINIARESDLLVIPAMEVTVKEEAHILCYFKDLDSCLSYSEYVYKHLPDIKNDEKLFGKQQVLDEEDEEISRVKKLLINATDISLDDLIVDIEKLGGAVVPAHVDKKNYSIIESLGFIPPNLPIETIEVSKNTSIEEFKKKMIFKEYQYITSSDAHQLEDILEKVFTINPKEKSVGSVIEYLMKR